MLTQRGGPGGSLIPSSMIGNPKNLFYQSMNGFATHRSSFGGTVVDKGSIIPLFQYPSPNMNNTGDPMYYECQL